MHTTFMVNMISMKIDWMNGLQPKLYMPYSVYTVWIMLYFKEVKSAAIVMNQQLNYSGLIKCLLSVAVVWFHCWIECLQFCNSINQLNWIQANNLMKAAKGIEDWKWLPNWFEWLNLLVSLINWIPGLKKFKPEMKFD